ncbi:MAG TPA: primosomal protein N', partial [Candidatus Saccharimonadales bacterium]|nr:primosomal protein N' [Candidatus Saccharimonadales bacterium]
MYFYEVWVRSPAYRGIGPLTYHGSQRLAIGSVVTVSLQKTKVWAVVYRTVSRPQFKTKPIVAIADIPPLPEPLLTLATEIATYYATPMGVVMQLILPADPEPKKSRGEHVVSSRKASVSKLPSLTTEQQEAVVHSSKPGTYLLHGKTGSGKTRVYIEKARQAIAQDKSCIILTPEISLTSQLAQQFRYVYGERVVILHSGLTPRERRDAWLNLLSSDTPKIVIGARSALFSPLQDIGLIVIDEAHEPAYKQEQAPYYHAVRVGSMLARMHQAVFILGSATPTVADYYVAEQKAASILTMTALATASDTSVRQLVVDLTDRSLLSRSRYLSDPLIAAIRGSLERREQSLLYLNRRGTARVILCDQCGWQALCPHCDLPLTYHADTHNVICHSCNFRGSVPVSCPECGNPSIVYKSAGTKSIVDEIERLFPEARVQRFDTDNRKAERFEQHYEAVQKGDVDILVGTQLLAKGLDLPKLST